MIIKIFNPDHDLALASNDINFIAPSTAKRMAQDLCLLPYWYSDNDIIISSHDMSSELKNIINKLNIKNQIICDDSKLKAHNGSTIEPWGWNFSIYKKLQNKGFIQLPDKEEIKRLRDFSSREFSIKLLNELLQVKGCCGQRIFLNSEKGLNEAINNGTPFLLKTLWSNSGKGILWCKNGLNETTKLKAISDIKKMGGIVYEPIYNNIKNFAMEFKITNGKAQFIGYSLFKTNKFGSYESNLLMHNKNIESEICKDINIATINKVKDKITIFINNKISKHYKNGLIGIDMMLCEIESKIYLHPCVEINIRMNMGIVALELTKRYLAEDKKGEFFISFYKKNEELKERDKQLKEKYPLIISADKKIKRGYISLTPIYKDTQYNAYVIIK